MARKTKIDVRIDAPELSVADTAMQVIPPARPLTEAEITLVKHFGANKYDSRRCMMLMGVYDIEVFRSIWESEQFQYYYELGYYEIEMVIHTKQNEFATDGDIASMKERQKRIQEITNGTNRQA